MRQSTLKLIESPIPEAMQIVGDNNKYQKIIIGLFSVLSFLVATIILGLSYSLMDASFKCSFSQQVIKEQQACLKMSQCQLINKFTIVGQLELYCERIIYRNLIESMFPIGSMFGFILMNFVCDIKGRRFSVLLCLSCAISANILIVIGVESQNIVILVFAYMLSGFGTYSLVIMTYVIFYDICSDSLRQKSMILMNVIWAIAEMSFYFYDRLQIRWDNFYIFIILIPLFTLTILINKNMLESPNFILDHRKDPQQTIQILDTIARINQISDEKSTELSKLIHEYYALKIRLSNQRGYHKITSLDIKRVLQKLFSNWDHCQVILILSIAYLSDQLFYFGVQYSLNEIGYDYGTNMFLMGFTQLLGFGILQYYSLKIAQIERIKGLIFFYYIGCFFGMLFAFKFVISSKILSTIFLCFCRFFTVCGYMFFSFLEIQSFRPKVRSTGAGLIQGFGVLGIFICPYLLTSLIQKHIHPIHVLAILMFFFVSPVLLLKQTLNNRLSTIRQTQLNQIRETSARKISKIETSKILI